MAIYPAGTGVQSVSTRPDPNKPGGFIRDAFPNNQIRPNLIDQRLVTFRQGRFGPLFNTAVANKTLSTIRLSGSTQKEFTARIDQNVATRNTSGSVTVQSTTTPPVPGGLPNQTQTITDNPGLITALAGTHIQPELDSAAQLRAVPSGNK